MKIIHYTDAKAHKFDGNIVKDVTGRVVIGKEDKASNFCMRVFTIAPAGFTPKHAHDWEHEIFVHSGEGSVFKNGKWCEVSAGSVIFIPGNEEHQLKNEGDEDFTFVCLIPSGVDEI